MSIIGLILILIGAIVGTLNFFMMIALIVNTVIDKATGDESAYRWDWIVVTLFIGTPYLIYHVIKERLEIRKYKQVL